MKIDDKIAEEIWHEFHKEHSYERCLDLSKTILALIDSSPTEMEAVKACDKGLLPGVKDHERHMKNCQGGCEGTGEIVRQLSKDEVVEMFINEVRAQTKLELPTFCTPSGERVRVGREKTE